MRDPNDLMKVVDGEFAVRRRDYTVNVREMNGSGRLVSGYNQVGAVST